MSKIQLRGHCQVCGNEQAVPNGRMSKHGYTIKNGWFNGVCQGEYHAPIEVSREHTDGVIIQIKLDCVQIQNRINGLRDGSIKPETFQVWNYRTGKYEAKPASELGEYAYRDALKNLIHSLEMRIRAGEQHIEVMTRIADQFHGKPLREVDVDANKPEPIQYGEKRIINDKGTVAAVHRIDGARVYYKCIGYDGKEYTTWQSSRTWRSLQKVA